MIDLQLRLQIGYTSTSLLPLGIALLALLGLIRLYRTRSLSYLLCFVVFGVYLLFAVDKAFFPIEISGDYADTMRQVPFTSFINLVPFNFGFSLSEMPELVVMQMYQNILLTVPFGFGLSFVARVRPKEFAWIIPATGVGIEAAQLIISLILRYPYHVIDVNDAILNASGVLIGYILFRLFAGVYAWAVRRLDIAPGGLPGYVYDVASRAKG
jgi:glycopeptide antibiotics resistance protein